MPELPEVETVAGDLRRAGLVGRTVTAVRLDWPPLVAPLRPRAFAARLTGRRIRALSRRAKYLVFGLSGGDTLLVHLRMTGHLCFAEPGAPRGPHEHLRLRLDDGRELCYSDTRKFGRWRLTGTPRDYLGRLGPEPLDPALTPAVLAARLRGRRRRLKPLLLEQGFVAGIGNIYADEILWTARLSPLREAGTLCGPDVRRLLAAMRQVLRRAVRRQGTTLGRGPAHFQRLNGERGRNQDGLRVFRRTRLPCPRCGAPIRRLIVAQRATHVCDVCQRP